MSLVRLYIRGISNTYSEKGNYLLIMSDEEQKRQMPIVVGAFEAHSIAIALDDSSPQPRPLTHDLLKNVAQCFSIQLKQVLINRFSQGIFYAQLICERQGEEHYIDARTSDAIALAIRFEVPIFIYKDIYNEFSVVGTLAQDEYFETDDFESYSLQGLEKLLQEALLVEDYEKAALLRDEITQRKNK